MSDQPSDPLVTVLVDRANSCTLLGGAADSQAGTQYPYAVIYADGGTRSADRESEQRVQQSRGFQTTVVGRSAEQCRAALVRIVDAFEDWTPQVEGWTCSVVDHESAQPVRKDEELPDRVLFYATDQWRFVADPA